MNIYGRFLNQGTPRTAQIETTNEGEIANFIGDLFQNQTPTGESAPVSELEIMTPVMPPKLFAIGLNYLDHIREHGREVPKEPVMWFKAPTALLPHGGEIEIAIPEHKTDFESELTLVIGKRGKAIPESEAHEYIFGATCGQDISDRVVQRGESQWTRAKSFDTYAPLGPYIYTGLDLSNLKIQTFLNGEIKQDGHTSDMIFSPAFIVSFVSQHITLEVGDIIMTGTPEGVGALKSGDVLETRIGEMKPLVNRVK